MFVLLSFEIYEELLAVYWEHSISENCLEAAMKFVADYLGYLVIQSIANTKNILSIAWIISYKN